MATRRNRIKGIANIPQRRKVENKPNVDVDCESKETSAQIGGVSISTGNELSADESIAQTATLNELITTEQELNLIKTTDNTCKGAQIVKVEADVSVKNEPNSDSNYVYNKNANKDSCELNETANKSNSLKSAIEKTASDPVTVTTHVDNEICTEVITSDVQSSSKSNSSANSSQDTNLSTSTSQRRTFIKPKVNIKSLGQKLKPKLCNTEQSPDIKEPPATASKDSEPVCNPQPDVQVLPPTINQISDTEIITEPPSPTKLLNRSRIKAVPRLHQRRISATIHGSASESEDDTRKSYKRVKTDSICSTTSSTCDPPAKNNPDRPPQNKDFSSIVQRKCKRSEQFCRMVEARRNFQNKFRNQTPEKQKLTMYDLIFYNPATKPMTQIEQSNKTEDRRRNSPTNCDSPDSNVESDGDDVPAPQIKIGKNGEIIVDEKSLIVENKQTKINRENLKNSELVNGDFDTGYGIYKRVKRSKDWSKEETLFFYKALHTLGTDFSLMAQLFPGRTRRELKMKFKKEDRINHALIDKALSQPLQFNIKELKQEVEHKRKKKELEELQKQKRSEEFEQQRKNTIPYTCFGTKHSKGPKHHKKNLQKSRQKEDIYSKLEKGIASVWNSNSEDEQVSSESSTEVTVANILKQTRFGRITTKKKIAQESTEATSNPAVDEVPHKGSPKELGEHQKLKEKKLKDDENDVQNSNDKEDNCDQLDDEVSSGWNSNSEDENSSSDSSGEVSVANILKQTRYGRIPNKRKVARESIDSSTNLTTDQSKELEPGSVMITCQPTSKGEPTFKVFMVTPTHTKVPIDFPSDVIRTFTKNIEIAEREPSCEQPLEHNYTICHDEGGG